MLSFNRASIVLVSIGSVSASAGNCLTGWTGASSTSVTSYAGPGSTTNWFIELTLSAVQRAKATGSSQFSTLNDVAAAGKDAYDGTTSPVGLLSTRTRNSALSASTGATTFSANIPSKCGECILNYAKEVYEMQKNSTLPEACQAYSTGYNSNANLGPCYFALSQALANFDFCTETTTTDLALGTDVKFSSTYRRCTASQIAELEGKYGIYQNIMNRGLFGSFIDDTFVAAYEALPCKAAFSDAISSFTTTVKQVLIADGICGLTKNTVKIFSNACVTAANAFGTSTPTAFFGVLETQVGGGVQIPVSNDKRCTANELSILNNFNIYDPFVKCSAGGTATGSAAFKTCMDGYWTTLGNSLFGTTPLTCGGCFTTTMGNIYTDKNLFTQCTGTFNSFSSLCAPQIAAHRHFATLYSCSGARLNTTATVGTVVEIAKIPNVINSVSPYISLARAVISDTTLATSSVKFGEALNRLASNPDFSAVTNTTFRACYGALTMELISNLASTSDSLASCSNEFDSACTSNTLVTNAMNKFKACSGIDLRTTSPYTCTAAQNQILVGSPIPQLIYTSAISNANSTIASVISEKNAALVKIANGTTGSLPCANCLDDVIVGLFNLPSDVKKVCAQLSRADCLRLPGVILIAAKYTQCSNQTLDMSAIINPVTPITPGGNDTDTNTTKASTASVVLGSVLLVIGAMML